MSDEISIKKKEKITSTFEQHLVSLKHVKESLEGLTENMTLLFEKYKNDNLLDEDEVVRNEIKMISVCIFTKMAANELAQILAYQDKKVDEKELIKIDGYQPDYNYVEAIFINKILKVYGC